MLFTKSGKRSIRLWSETDRLGVPGGPEDFKSGTLFDGVWLEVLELEPGFSTPGNNI